MPRDTLPFSPPLPSGGLLFPAPTSSGGRRVQKGGEREGNAKVFPGPPHSPAAAPSSRD